MKKHSLITFSILAGLTSLVNNSQEVSAQRDEPLLTLIGGIGTFGRADFGGEVSTSAGEVYLRMARARDIVGRLSPTDREAVRAEIERRDKFREYFMADDFSVDDYDPLGSIRVSTRGPVLFKDAYGNIIGSMDPKVCGLWDLALGVRGESSEKMRDKLHHHLQGKRFYWVADGKKIIGENVGHRDMADLNDMLVALRCVDYVDVISIERKPDFPKSFVEEMRKRPVALGDIAQALREIKAG